VPATGTGTLSLLTAALAGLASRVIYATAGILRTQGCISGPQLPPGAINSGLFLAGFWLRG